MRQPWDWEEEDIESLIQNGVQESLTLDYKECGALYKNNPKRKQDLSKDVSAFANSAGGVIVYGVIETNNLPTAIDTGYDPEEITREWLEQVINSTIQRRIDGIRIKQIELKKNSPGCVIYVVSIPQSKRAPHMAENHIFYKRFNYQSIPMEEYEVRDVATRVDTPDLSLDFSLEHSLINLEYDDNSEFSKPINLYASIKNESPTPAMYSIIKLGIDSRIKVLNNSDFSITNKMLVAELFIDVYTKNHSPIGEMPVWEGVKFGLLQPGTFQLAIPKNASDTNYILIWSIQSPGMPIKEKKLILMVSNAQATILNV